MKSSPRVLLLDNGSLEPASTRQLRLLATALAARIGMKVEPVSLAHSSRIAADALDGKPAELLDAAMDRCGKEGLSEVVVVPLYIGPSHALTQLVPALLADLGNKYPHMRVRVASPLQQPGETRLGEIIADEIRAQISSGVRPRVAVVDHGSPVRAVAEMRDEVAVHVRMKLGDVALDVTAASMERRVGGEFEFNEPLLESLLARPAWQSDPLVVALLFVAPGRHAGTQGDVVNICRRARTNMANVKFTRVLGQHPRLIEILADRFHEVVN